MPQPSPEPMPRPSQQQGQPPAAKLKQPLAPGPRPQPPPPHELMPKPSPAPELTPPTSPEPQPLPDATVDDSDESILMGANDRHVQSRAILEVAYWCLYGRDEGVVDGKWASKVVGRYFEDGKLPQPSHEQVQPPTPERAQLPAPEPMPWTPPAQVPEQLPVPRLMSKPSQAQEQEQPPAPEPEQPPVPELLPQPSHEHEQPPAPEPAQPPSPQPEQSPALESMLRSSLEPEPAPAPQLMPRPSQQQEQPAAAELKQCPAPEPMPQPLPEPEPPPAHELMPQPSPAPEPPPTPQLMPKPSPEQEPPPSWEPEQRPAPELTTPPSPEPQPSPDGTVDDSDELILIEAGDNHVQSRLEFINRCLFGRDAGKVDGKWASKDAGKYFEGGKAAGGQLTDQCFCGRILEGELRYRMVNTICLGVIHKVPAPKGISAVGVLCQCVEISGTVILQTALDKHSASFNCSSVGVSKRLSAYCKPDTDTPNVSWKLWDKSVSQHANAANTGLHDSSNNQWWAQQLNQDWFTEIVFQIPSYCYQLLQATEEEHRPRVFEVESDHLPGKRSLH
jgi:hypothetical protein